MDSVPWTSWLEKYLKGVVLIEAVCQYTSDGLSMFKSHQDALEMQQ